MFGYCKGQLPDGLEYQYACRAEETDSMSLITHLPLTQWSPSLTSAQQDQWLQALESGQVLHCPHLAFAVLPEETRWMNQTLGTMKAKNISFNPAQETLKGMVCDAATEQLLQGFCQRFYQQATALVTALFPAYQPALKAGMTSLRPVEVAGRTPASYKKDDARLHIDAFPSRPNQGRRILRVFSNINPHGKPRVWRVGEPFVEVAKRFAPQVPRPFPGSAWLLQALHITKGPRTRYDHTMLHIHDRMKADTAYQNSVAFEEIAFAPGSTWIVFSDSVSHAVLAGQHMLEQTFYLPPEAMRSPELSPLKVLENIAGRALA